MRSFLFHYERKMKRAAKIKSRKYRRLHKRDREQNQLSVEELHELDPALAKREVEKRELERIKVDSTYLLLMPFLCFFLSRFCACLSLVVLIKKIN